MGMETQWARQKLEVCGQVRWRVHVDGIYFSASMEQGCCTCSEPFPGGFSESLPLLGVEVVSHWALSKCPGERALQLSWLVIVEWGCTGNI